MDPRLHPASLEGDLAHFFPSEVLQLLQLAQSTGRLEFQRGDETVALWWDRGRPVFARTTGAVVRSGELLRHRSAIAVEAIARALERQRHEPGRRLGALLVEQGDATPEQVGDAVHECLRRIVYGVLLWRDGRFRFLPGDSPEGEDIRLDLDLDRLILEGLRLADQERAARTGVPGA
jgi:hypothetical protein